MRIGIFDIGTRATRLLISDTRNFLQFRKNFGTLTHLGEAFDDENNINIQAFEPTMTAISDFLQEGKKFGVQKYIAVGTAALRKANNKDQILQLIETVFGLRVSILEKEEEAYLSLLSVFVHFGESMKEKQPIILIDQGGGSTEVSIGQLKNDAYDFLGLASLELGSIELKNRFLENDSQKVSVAYDETLKHIVREISTAPFLSDYKKQKPVKAFGMGSAITTMTRMKGNKKQHGFSMTQRWMNRAIDARHSLYSANDKTIQNLLQDNELLDSNDNFEKDMLTLYGLPVYLELLDHFRLNEITVCGYGLRYGVFFYFAFPKVVKRPIPIHITNNDEIRYQDGEPEPEPEPEVVPTKTRTKQSKPQPKPMPKKISFDF